MCLDTYFTQRIAQSIIFGILIHFLDFQSNSNPSMLFLIEIEITGLIKKFKIKILILNYQSQSNKMDYNPDQPNMTKI